MSYRFYALQNTVRSSEHQNCCLFCLILNRFQSMQSTVSLPHCTLVHPRLFRMRLMGRLNDKSTLIFAPSNQSSVKMMVSSDRYVFCARVTYFEDVQLKSIPKLLNKKKNHNSACEFLLSVDARRHASRVMKSCIVCICCTHTEHGTY